MLNKTNKNTTDIATLNNNLGGNIITYNESEDAYYIQHGADSVPKKLGKSSGQVEFVVSTGGKEEHWSTVSFQNIDEKTLVIKQRKVRKESWDRYIRRFCKRAYFRMRSRQ